MVLKQNAFCDVEQNNLDLNHIYQYMKFSITLAANPPWNGLQNTILHATESYYLSTHSKKNIKQTKRAKLWDEARASLIKSVTPSFKKSLENNPFFKS